jgi:hypothetical protein
MNVMYYVLCMYVKQTGPEYLIRPLAGVHTLCGHAILYEAEGPHSRLH